MKTEIKSHRTSLSAEDRDWIERRIHFGFDRFAPRIRCLTLQLTDLNGPKGGIDQLCDVRISMLSANSIFASAKAASLHEATRMALDRAERSLSRSLKRRLGIKPSHNAGQLSMAE